MQSLRRILGAPGRRSTLSILVRFESTESQTPLFDNVVYLRRQRRKADKRKKIESAATANHQEQQQKPLSTQLVTQVVAALNDTVYVEDFPEKLGGFRGKLGPRDVAMVLKLVRDMRLAFGFFNWARQEQDPGCFDLDVFLTMVRRLLVAHKWEELNIVVDWMHQNNFYLDFRLFETVIKEASDAQQPDVCEKWFRLMREISVKPNVFIYNLMIRVYAREGRSREALEIFSEMEESKVKPTVVTYSQLFSVCRDIGECGIAKVLLSKMRMQGIQPDRLAYTTLMSVYAKAGQFEEAEALFASMEKSGVQADVLLLNCLLNSYVKAGELERARSVFRERLQHQPNEATYVIMLGLYCKAGLHDDALELLKTVDHGSVKLGEQFFVTLVKAFAEAERWDDSIAAFKEMQKSSCRIRGSVYVLLLDVSFRAGYHELCVEFFAAALDKGINRTPGVYETVIRAYDAMNRVSGVVEVFGCMQEMLCPFTPDVYELLHVIFTRENKPEMLQALENTKESGRFLSVGKII